MASYSSDDMKPTAEMQTVYVCGSCCGFKGGLAEVSAHSTQCSAHLGASTPPPVHNITVLDSGRLAGVSPLASSSGPPAFLHTQTTAGSASSDAVLQTDEAAVAQVPAPYKSQVQVTQVSVSPQSQPALPGLIPTLASAESPISAVTGVVIDATETITTIAAAAAAAELTTNAVESPGAGSVPSTTPGIASTSSIEKQNTGKEDDRNATVAGMLMWTAELVSVLVECYVALMHDAGVGAQKKRIYEQVAVQVHSRTGMAVTAEQVGNKIKFMRKQHMAVKAMLMSNRHVPGAKMTPHFKVLDEVFSKDNTSAPLNRALEKCLGGKVKVIQPSKGIQGGCGSPGSSNSSIVVVQQADDKRNSIGSAFSQYVAKLIDELADDQRDEVQEHILSYIFGVKQQSRERQTAASVTATTAATTAASTTTMTTTGVTPAPTL